MPPAVNVKMATYENREKPENFYSIQFPTDMNVIHGNQPGNLIAESPQRAFSVDLVDIPGKDARLQTKTALVDLCQRLLEVLET